MGKASGGQKEEKMKMRKNKRSPKKKKKKDGLKAKENKMEVKKSRKATVSQAALLTLTVWKRLCECYHEILQY